MVPAFMSQPFRPGEATFIPGLGFRVVVDGTCQCAIDDRPSDGKATLAFAGPRPGDCPALDMAVFGFSVGAPARPVPLVPSDLAPVPLPGAGALLAGAVLTIALARPIWSAMGRFGDWFTADRGTGPHQCGWV